MTSSSLLLHPFSDTDSEFFATLASDERVVRFIGYGKPWNQQDIDACIVSALQHDELNQVGASRWFVASMAGQAVGVVFSTRQENSIEIGYWVSPAHWGRGVGGTMLDQTLDMVPELFGLATLSAGVAPGNTISAKLLTQRGFTLTVHTDQLDHYVLTRQSN